MRFLIKVAGTKFDRIPSNDATQADAFARFPLAMAVVMLRMDANGA
jgi:hypothetical protein